MFCVNLSRMGLPEEIAAAVVYLAGDESAYTTGQILAVSGGFGLATLVYGDLAKKTLDDNRRIEKLQHDHGKPRVCCYLCSNDLNLR